MGNPDYSSLVERQGEYFLSGTTRPAAWRKARLEALKALFTENHDELCEALWEGLASQRHRRRSDGRRVQRQGSRLRARAPRRLDGTAARPHAARVRARPRPRTPRSPGSDADHRCVQDEVFGPILPVLEIDSLEAVIVWVNSRPRPLGIYVFAEDLDVAERILDATESGDAAINDCTIHPLVLSRRSAVSATPGWEIPRPLGVPGVYQRAWRDVPRRADRPGRAIPAVLQTHHRTQNRRQVDAVASARSRPRRCLGRRIRILATLGASVRRRRRRYRHSRSGAWRP